MTLSERLKDHPTERRLPANVIPFRRPTERRAVPRWLEYTRQNEQRGKDLTGFSGDAA